MNKNNSPNDHGMTFLLIGLAAFFLYKASESVTSKATQYAHTHRFGLIAITVTVVVTLAALVGATLWNCYQDRQYEKDITAIDDTAALLGKTEKGVALYLKEAFRTSHTQLIGS